MLIFRTYLNISNAEYFLNNITNHPILGSISYLGWLGVPMFFFLSGYGLQKKYGGKIHNQFSFIKKHYLKLLCLAGPIIIINNLHAHIKIVHILGQLTFLNNIPFENNILPAAFWYLRVALQFYILYALFFFRIKPKYLLFSGIVISICFIFIDDQVTRLFKYHFIGWFLDFALGCYFAVNNNCIKQIEKKGYIFFFFVILLISCVNKHLWIFCDTISILFLLSIKRFINIKLLIHIGTLSAVLYVTHPLVRNLWLYINIDYMKDNILLISISLIFYFISCISTAFIYKYFYDYVIYFIKIKRNYGKNESQ